MPTLDSVADPSRPASGSASRLRAGALLHRLVVWDARYRERRHLADLDAPALRDCGLTGGDVAGESAKPFWRT